MKQSPKPHPAGFVALRTGIYPLLPPSEKKRSATSACRMAIAVRRQKLEAEANSVGLDPTDVPPCSPPFRPRENRPTEAAFTCRSNVCPFCHARKAVAVFDRWQALRGRYPALALALHRGGYFPVGEPPALEDRRGDFRATGAAAGACFVMPVPFAGRLPEELHPFAYSPAWVERAGPDGPVLKGESWVRYYRFWVLAAEAPERIRRPSWADAFETFDDPTPWVAARRIGRGAALGPLRWFQAPADLTYTLTRDVAGSRLFATFGAFRGPDAPAAAS
jgi:hypothetical protein